MGVFSVRKTTEQFIDEAIAVHGDRYDYSKVEYKTSKDKVCISCPVHGEFWQYPNDHLRGAGCPSCAIKYRSKKRALTTERFIEKAKSVHGNKYGYSKVNYVNSDTKVCVICPIHGEFLQRPADHLNGSGCNQCRGIFTTENFILKANVVHKGKYDYSKTKYISNKNKVCITCPTHGDFLQNAGDHLSGKGCSKCGYERNSHNFRDTLDAFIIKAKSIHGDKYDYSNVVYTNNSTKVEIQCPKHGSFLQTPNNHLSGQGCPLCFHSKGEDAIMRFLDAHQIEYEYQYRILTHPASSGNKNIFKVDFFLPAQRTIIEFNGIQHYEEVSHFHENASDFERQKARDKKLKKWCKDNDTNLITIKYTQIDNIERILKNKLLNNNGNENN